MSDSTEELRQQLKDARRELSEARARCDRHDAELLADAKELDDNRSALLFMLEDLENSRQKIAAAHQIWMDALDAVNDPIFLHDKDLRILRCNKAYQQCAGLPFHELIGQLYYEVFPKTHAPLPHCLLAMKAGADAAASVAADEDEVLVGEATYRSRAFPIHDEQGVYLYSVHTLEDITERKRAEQVLRRANRALRTLSAGNETLIHATDELQLLQAMCQVAVDKGGYRMAWVGYAEQDAGQTIRPMAQAGFEEGFLGHAHITWADTEHGQGASGRAVRSRQTQIEQNIALDPGLPSWRIETHKRGYSSCIALPLLEKGKCFGVLTLYAAEPDAFDADEIKLLEEMSDDLAFGILTLRVRVEHREHEQRLQKNMLQTVEAIASIVEMRDPYTSGHQIRVAEIARAIARQMGIEQEQADVIYLAGLVHDLGKIRVPAEILSKPGKLNDAEISLIKMHPQAGYDILKNIDFSWPIAQMVLQHHERMDGSGYPQGLKGEDILLEARILSVADVVEAMSSHRPYRPGLGIDAAMEDIKRSSGIYFDARVVDACVALFKEHGYAIPR